MNHAVLQFAEQFFLRLNLHTALIPWELPCPSDSLDLGIRGALSGGEQTLVLNGELLQADLPGEHILCTVEDRFRCRSLLIPVPGQEIPVVLKAGPYLNTVITGAEMEAMFGEKALQPDLSLFLSQYYATLTRFENDRFLEDFLFALAKQLYGPEKSEVRFLSLGSLGEEAVFPGSAAGTVPDLVSRLEQRYGLEDRLMDVIARGDADAAVSCLQHPLFSNPDIRTSVPLRSIMNYAIILNTLCRKAAQRGGVHPVHLDDISRRFAMRIESAAGIPEVKRLQQEMVRRYALLVRSMSTEGYSPVVRDVINYIHLHYMDSGLTLSFLASLFSVNRSYLSTLFRKETGKALTDFVNEYRIDQALFLLNTGTLSTGSIASACGIPDAAYFSRLFRRSKGLFPSEYRKMVRGQSASDPSRPRQKD